MGIFCLVLSVIFIALHLSQLADNRLSIKYKGIVTVLLTLWVINFYIHLGNVISSVMGG